MAMMKFFQIEQAATETNHIDLGLLLNAEMRMRWFEPGELLQSTCRVNGLKVWIAHYVKRGEYRVGFGEEPIPMSRCEPMDAERAMATVIEEVRNHVRMV